MLKTTIQINKERKDLLVGLKYKYSLGTFDICVNTLALFVLRNNIILKMILWVILERNSSIWKQGC